MNETLFLVTAYLLGSVSFGIVTCKLFGLPDPRTHGSGNPGATNVLRSGKKLAAVLTLLGDAAKGWVAVWLAQRYELPEAWVLGIGAAAFVGHLFPVYYGFKGGKGVATVAGILIAVSPWLGLSVFATWALAFYMWRVSSLSAIIAAAFAPVYSAAIFGFNLRTAFVLVLALVLIERHKSNIKRLLAGEEKGFGKPKAGDQPPG